MNLKYINLLRKQYMAACGLKVFDNSKEQIGEFVEWIKQQKKIQEYYQCYLLMAGMYFNESTSVEVGKGKQDTITSPDTRAVLITPYASSFDKEKKPECIFDGKLQMSSIPYIFVETPEEQTRTSIFLDKMDLFYTQNVYSSKELDIFKQIHNSGRDIALGAYGKLSDKDRIQKIKQLRQFRETLIGQKFKEFYTYTGDDYVYCLHTDTTSPKSRKRKER